MKMTAQSLSAFDQTTRRVPVHRHGRFASAARRLLVLGGTSLVTGLAINEMRLVLNVGGLTVLEIVVLVLFAINTVWIALPSLTGLVGFFLLLFRRRVRSGKDNAPLTTRTALLIPLCNEEPALIGAAIDAMASDLVALGEGHSFDVFVLSDSTEPDVALAEEEVVWVLRRRLGDTIGLYYRRRVRNTGHKPGNIREFCERWGRGYDHLLILDADSLMEGATMVELARRMEREPDAGLIQTVPRLHGGTTLVARMQQFAGAVYGPVLAAGLAWWTGREGNFWGHNAIIRSQAFMDSASLPELPGKPPLGGGILSHDFVEAALIRRAGWSVQIADDLQGSYEACPSTLIDLSVRDRRWCQGNLQHTRVLTAKGLHWVSRLHLLTGIFAFVSSPVWLLFILTAFALGVQNEFAKPEYFTRAYTLFPMWPHLDPVRALRLFGISLVILLAPKVLGLVHFACSGRRLRASGGPLLLMSFLVEIVLSALLAPILMLIHCGFVVSILAGRDSGWRPQKRGDNKLPWRQVAYRHRWHMVAGLALAASSLFISWEMLAWLSQAAVGMVAAIPLSLVTGYPVVGRWPRRLRLLQIPEEVEPPTISRKMEAVHSLYKQAVEQVPDLIAIVGDSERLQRHMAMTDMPPPRHEEPIAPLEATADLKVRSARSLEDALTRLTSKERAYVQSAPDLLLQLSRLPRRPAPQHSKGV